MKSLKNQIESDLLYAYELGELRVEPWQENPYTAVFVNAEDYLDTSKWFFPNRTTATQLGFSKCNPNDEFSSSTGLNIAVVRALRKMARDLASEQNPF